MLIEKSLPHNLEAEKAILGALLLSEEIKPKVKEDLLPQDFYFQKHQILFPVLLESFDLAIISDQLEKQGLLEKAGGMTYVASLADEIVTTAAADHHIEIIKEHSRSRQIINLCYKALDSAGQASSEQLASFLRQNLSAMDFRDHFGQRAGVDISNVYTPERCLEAYSQHVSSLKQNRFITGIHEIDKRIRGVAGGEVLFIIARAGSFKTALLQNLLKGYIQHSAWAAAFFSLEMPIASVTERYHSIIQNAQGREIETFYSSEKEGVSIHRETLEAAFKKDLENLFIIPTKVSIRDIAAYTRLIEKEYKIKIGAIGVDYLGLMEGKGQNPYEITSRLARGCKTLAKILNLPLIVIAQTSRKAGSGDVEITLDMARDSGAIEEAADFCLGLFQVNRDRLPIELGEPEQELICKILKNRKGPKGSRWKLDLDPETLRIGPDAEPWEPPKKSNSRAYDG